MSEHEKTDEELDASGGTAPKVADEELDIPDDTDRKLADEREDIIAQPLPSAAQPILLARNCERYGNPQGACTLCLDVCPRNCLYLDPAAGGPAATDETYVPVLDGRHCLGCNLCCAACPTGALTSLGYDLVQLKARMDRLAEHYDRLYLTCTRTGASTYSGAVIEVPCLGGLPWEFYHSCLADYRDMSVFLPLELCADCPCSNGEELMMEAIGKAEQMSQTSLGLACEKSDLDFSVINSGFEAVDRRGFLTSVTDYLSDATRKSQSTLQTESLGLGNREERARRVMQANRAAREEREKRFAEAHETGFLRTKARSLVPRRKILKDTLDAHPELIATTVTLSVRNDDSCTQCRTCLHVCPVQARCVRDMKLSTDDAYCIGCGKCVEMCPEQAIYLVEIRGGSLFDEDGR